MTNIVLTCCILYIFLCGVDKDQSWVDKVDHKLMEKDLEPSSSQLHEDDYKLGSQLRVDIK